MVVVKAYSTHRTYCVDVWKHSEDTVMLLDEYEINHTSMDSVAKVREYIKLVANKFDMIKVKDDTGIW
jgi:Sec7-like guanine-nucleotide exchange factor